MKPTDDILNFVTSDLNSATMTGVVDSEELVKSFIEKHGEEIQRTTKDFTNKAIGSGYSVEDAFIEFTDNSYDSIEHNRAVNFEINVDSVNHVILFKDDGDGIKDPDKLFQLGGTDKDGKSGKIGTAGTRGGCRYGYGNAAGHGGRPHRGRYPRRAARQPDRSGEESVLLPGGQNRGQAILCERGREPGGKAETILHQPEKQVIVPNGENQENGRAQPAAARPLEDLQVYPPLAGGRTCGV